MSQRDAPRRRFAISTDSIAHTFRLLLVGSRVLSGSITIGDEFSHLCTRDDWSAHHEHGCSCVAVSLTIEKLLVYDKYVNGSEEGLAVEVALAGSLDVRISPSDVLCGESERAMPKAFEILGEGRSRVPVV